MLSLPAAQAASTCFALCDCNNFYASCERAFRPDLVGQPVLVLSNNDGCVIARSTEVKRLGIPMGAPIHQYQHVVRAHHIHVFSANFGLYGDLSARVMAVLARFTHASEVYSVDEAFLDVAAAAPAARAAYGQTIRQTVRTWTGIPISVGIAPTKTLAKVANELAKTRPAGVVVLAEEAAIDAALAGLDVADVWGIGPRRAERLRAAHIHTALDLKHAPDGQVKRLLHVPGLRTTYELRGISCLPLECVPPPRQHLACTRSFGRAVRDLADLREAVASYAARAAAKLRHQHSLACTLTVAIRTNSFQPHTPQCNPSCLVRLAAPTADTPTLLRAATAGLTHVFRPGYAYHWAGVFLSDLVPAAAHQVDLFTAPEVLAQQQAAMQVLDAINTRFGRDTIKVAATGLAKGWRMRQAHRSPRYTTCVTELPEVR